MLEESVQGGAPLKTKVGLGHSIAVYSEALGSRRPGGRLKRKRNK